MIPCHVVEISTPKKFLLRGLWFGPKKPKRAIVFVHGLGGSVFSMRNVITKLVGKNTAVLAFNNRGHDVVSRVRQEKRRARLAGAAHEVFTDCVDDIQGTINFARRQGVKHIFLAGHSTGCQKSVYWAYKKRGRGVKGIILFAPVSDFAAEMKRQGKRKIARAAEAARALVHRGKKHTLLPEGLWHETLDAQRFLSLYSPDSVEEIFSYAQPSKVAKTLRSVSVPILPLWAGNDEFADRPAKDIVGWFGKHMRRGKAVIIPRVKHNFRGGEKRAAREIRLFLNTMR